MGACGGAACCMPGAVVRAVGAPWRPLPRRRGRFAGGAMTGSPPGARGLTVPLLSFCPGLGSPRLSASLVPHTAMRETGWLQPSLFWDSQCWWKINQAEWLEGVPVVRVSSAHQGNHSPRSSLALLRLPLGPLFIHPRPCLPPVERRLQQLPQV